MDLIVDDTPGVIVSVLLRQGASGGRGGNARSDRRRTDPPDEDRRGGQATKKDFDEHPHGKDAVMECNLGVPGSWRPWGVWSTTSYGQNVLKHSLEVAFISQLIADQWGSTARRTSVRVPHDIGKAMDHEMEGGHPKIGMDFARQYGESDPCSMSSAGTTATSLRRPSTPIVMAADALSGARPGARRESLALYIKRLSGGFQDIAAARGASPRRSHPGRSRGAGDGGCPRINDDKAFYIARKIADQVSAEMTFPGGSR